MNSYSDQIATVTEVADSKTVSADINAPTFDHEQRSQIRKSRSSVSDTNTNKATTNNGSRRQKEVSPCYVCGAKANGYNFDQSNNKSYIKTRIIVNFNLVISI